MTSLINKTLLITKQNKTIIIITILLLSLYFYNFSQLKMVNFDHLAFSNHSFTGTINRIFQYNVVHQARPNFITPFTTAIEYLLVDHYWIWTVIFYILSGYIVGAIINAYTNNFKISFLGFLLSVCFSTISLEPISMPTAYAFSLGFGILMVLASVYFTIMYNKSRKYYYKILAVISIVLGMFSYEVGVLYLPFLIGINCYYARSFNIKKNIQMSLEYILTGITYVISYIIITSLYESAYGGTKISSNFDFLRIIYTWLFMLIATIPGFLFFYNKSNAYKSPISYILNYKNDISANYIDFLFIFQIILFSYLVYNIIVRMQNNGENITYDNKKIQNNKNLKKWNTLGIILIIYAIIIPFLPSSLTEYTQNQVSVSWRLIGVFNQYSYFFIIISLVLIIYNLLKIIKSRKVISLVLSFILLLQFSIITFTNRVNAEIVDENGTRFKQLDLIIHDIANEVGNNGIIYAPSLFTSTSPLSVPLFYYNEKFACITKKSIKVIKELDNIQENDNIYYLRYLYSSDKINTLLILSKVTLNQLELFEKEEDIIKSDNAIVYCFSGQRSFNLIGRVNSDTEGELIKITKDNKKTEVFTEDIIQYEINQNRDNFGKPIIIYLSGNNINLNSISILPYYSMTTHKSTKIDLNYYKIGNTLATSKIISGYYKDGWLAKSSEFKIRTGSLGKIILSGYYPNQITGNETGTVYIDSKSYPFIITEKKFIREFPAKPNAIITLSIENDFEFQAPEPDKRRISFVLTDIQCE